MNSRDFQDRLADRAKRAGIAIPDSLGTKLETYYRLLAAWNRKINLTGMELSDGAPEAIDRLLVEPVAAARHASQGSRIIDIGSGGGSPAIPFSLAVGAGSLLMVESKTRKSAFLKEAIRALEMTEAEVAASRFESLLSNPTLREAHDLLTLRAVRVDGKFLLSLQPFVKSEGRIFLFRGSRGVPDGLMPPLQWLATFPLIDSLQSKLVVLGKTNSGLRNDECST